MFKPNKHFRKKYDALFRLDPLTANVFLLLAELADENGEVKIDDSELLRLAVARFEDPRRYQFERGGPRV